MDSSPPSSPDDGRPRVPYLPGTDWGNESKVDSWVPSPLTKTTQTGNDFYGDSSDESFSRVLDKLIEDSDEDTSVALDKLLLNDEDKRNIRPKSTASAKALESTVQLGGQKPADRKAIQKEKNLWELPIKHLVDRDYILKVLLVGVKDENGEDDLIWRKIKVNAGMKLCLFQDKVLNPSVGWARNLHCYMFRQNGIEFGPRDGKHKDRIRIKAGHEYEIPYFPDDNYRLAHLFQDENSKLEYIYDMTTKWEHEITVEEILPRKNSDGASVLLDGHGGCPGESFDGGNKGYYEAVRDHWENPQSGVLWYRLRECFNYRNQPAFKGFDPKAFVLLSAQQRVTAALATTRSYPPGPKIFIDSPRELSTPDPGTDQHIIQAYPRKLMAEMVRTDPDPKDFALCEGCGRPYGLKQCDKCHFVWYCGARCQKDKWGAHKLKCQHYRDTGKRTQSKPPVIATGWRVREHDG